MGVRKRATKPRGKKAPPARTKKASPARTKKASPARAKAPTKTRSKPTPQRGRKGKAPDAGAAAGSGQPAGNGPAANGHDSPAGKLGIRVRMYRVGFGDFFLLTVPGNDGPAHILIDCGVHAKDIKSINQCVQDLMETTKKRLAL